MNEPSVFGKRLRRYRESQGLSISELSRRSGVHKVSISQVELGTRVNLSLENWIRIADAMGVSLDRLVREDPWESELMAALA